MKIRKCFKHAFEMVIHSKLRSWLTILGIVIGVGAVIAIMSLGSSLQNQVTSQLGSLGGDIITVTPGASRGGEFRGPPGEGGSSSGSSATTEEVVLDRSDYQVIKGLSNIDYIDTEIRGSVKVSYLGKAGTVSLTGVDQKVWAKVTTSTLAEGRMLDSADQNVIVIGGRLASSYFSQPLGVNKVITINGQSFRIVGILDDSSTQIYMPLSMSYQLINDSTVGQYDTIVVKVKDENLVNDTLTKIESSLRTKRHVTEKTQDFSAVSSKQAQATRAQLMSTLNTFLLAIAAVSLVVGAVGVANTMFTSVLEKTKEIGIMKAIGARNKDIMMIFLLNAALIGLVGGFFGVLFGILLSGLLPAITSGTIPFIRGSGSVISLTAIFLALGVSMVIGMIAGSVPAYQASKLKPVDALRYE
jgi:putative ABC transport system permease protein